MVIACLDILLSLISIIAKVGMSSAGKYIHTSRRKIIEIKVLRYI
jgi:vesicle coat complex subunit